MLLTIFAYFINEKKISLLKLMVVVQFSANTELWFQEPETEPQVNSVMCSIDEGGIRTCDLDNNFQNPCQLRKLAPSQTENSERSISGVILRKLFPLHEMNLLSL